MSALRAYGILLRLYPRDYRARFAAEMVATCEQAARESRQQGRAAYVRFVLGELTALAIGAGVEWIAKRTTDAAVRGRCLPDLLKMRPAGVSWETHYAARFLSIPEEVRAAQQQGQLRALR